MGRNARRRKTAKLNGHQPQRAEVRREADYWTPRTREKKPVTLWSFAELREQLFGEATGKPIATDAPVP